MMTDRSKCDTAASQGIQIACKLLGAKREEGQGISITSFEVNM